MESGDLLEPFDCPRCGAVVTERFWGPCTSCRQALKAAHVANPESAAVAEHERFEPSMNVTPNFVATKD